MKGKCFTIFMLMVLIVVAAILPTWAAFRAKDVKIIQWGWSMPPPSWIRTNIGTMEQTAFEGLGTDWHENGTDWDTTTYKWAWKMWGNTNLDPNAYSTDINDYADTAWNRFRSNLMDVRVSPGNLDLFSTDYNHVLSNAYDMSAQFAAHYTADYEGYLVDLEKYANSYHWNYELMPWHNDNDPTRDYAAYKAQAKLRGQQFMQNLTAAPGCPSAIDVLVPISYTFYNLYPTTYGLLPSFIDGMLLGCRSGDRIHDGYENAYGYKTQDEFKNAYVEMTSTGGIRSLSTEKAEFDAHYKPGYGLCIDIAGTANEFYYSVQRAVNYGEKYVWIYNQDLRWWNYPSASNIGAGYRTALANVARTGSLERFDGTSLDTGTWEKYGSGTITQNYGLTIDGQTTSNNDYTTKTFTVGIGKVAFVNVTVLTTNTYGTAALILTNDSGGTGGPTINNDTWFFGILWVNSGNDVIALKCENGVQANTIVYGTGMSVGTEYILAVQYTSSTQAHVALYDKYCNQLGSTVTLTFSSTMPDNLYISLVSSSCKTKFEHLWRWP